MAAPDIIIRTDLDGIITFINQSELKDYDNLPMDEIIGQSMFNYLSEEDLDRAKRNFNLMFKKKLGVREYKIILNGNIAIDCEVKGEVIRDINYNPIGLVFVIRDITESKKASKIIFEKEEQYRVLFESAGDAIFVMKDDKFVDCNMKTLEMFDCEREQIIGFSPTNFSPEFQPDGISSKIKAWEKIDAALKGLPQFFEWSHIKLNGGEFYAEVSLNRICYNNSTYLQAIVRNVTDKKNAEEALRISEDRFKQVAECADEWICEIDNYGIYTYSSPVVEKILGYKPEELIQKKHVYDLFPIETKEKDTNLLMQNIKEKKSFFRMEKKMISKEANLVILESSGVPIIDKQGNMNGYRCTNSDITERKKIERALLSAKEKAIESDKLKTAFLQNISHEIRTPLNGILGFSKLLQKNNCLKEEIIEYANIITQSGERLLDTITKILDISEIETGQVSTNYSQFSLNNLIYEIYNNHKNASAAKGLKISYFCGLDNDNSIIYSDESKVHRILTYLLNNAIKFTYNGGIEFGYTINHDKIKFIVKDTGKGIPDNLKHRVFLRFTQTDLSFNREHEGVGLGLAICKGLVGILNGNIWFESEEHLGSSFFFTLPHTTCLQSTIGSKDNNKISDYYKILIAEDDKTSLVYMEKIFRKYGIETIMAENGVVAIEKVKANPDIQLILMDVKMPKLNGLLATKKIKELRPDIPIIAQTAYAMIKDRDYFLQNGFDDYISKPLFTEDLVKIVRKYLELNSFKTV